MKVEALEPGVIIRAQKDRIRDLEMERTSLRQVLEHLTSKGGRRRLPPRRPIGRHPLRAHACGHRGFTLVEMLVSMALLIIFGGIAIGVLRGGTALWRAGHRRSVAYDTATLVFAHIADDLNATASIWWGRSPNDYNPDVKLWVDFDNPAGLQADRQRLRLVRRIPEDTLNPRLRSAGDGRDTDNDGNTLEESYNRRDDDSDGRVDEDLEPLGGLMEIAYMRGVTPADADSLYRAVCAPIGSALSLFNDGNVASPPDVGEIIAQDVLHFEVRCWTQYTTTWSDDVPFTVWAASWQPEPCGPVFGWDSDRLATGPAFLMDWGTALFPDRDDDNNGIMNSQDADYCRDNVLPALIRVVVVADAPPKLRRKPGLHLADPLSAADGMVPISGQLPAYNTAWPFVRIDDEWIEFASYDANSGELTVAAGGRGARETEPADHAAGATVRFGQTFTRVFRCPTARADW